MTSLDQLYIFLFCNFEICICNALGDGISEDIHANDLEACLFVLKDF